ncbi:energy transducer TonB [Chitinimonas sp. BJB300]|uniref:energy transducer TonB n=2 Tax=Chitinimonas sp. BJB300 TaxID=1559339 RepID=UPI001643224A|nr:energy transducer TonB [Chitinimonas sp. BJB300]
MAYLSHCKLRMTCAMSTSLLVHLGFLLLAIQQVIHLQPANQSGSIGVEFDYRTPLIMSQPDAIASQTQPLKTERVEALAAPITLKPESSKPTDPLRNTQATVVSHLASQQPVAGESIEESDSIIQWQEKLLRIGEVNAPTDLAGHALQGEVRIQLEVRADGSLIKAVLVNSSGETLLDEAALRLVRIASPFARSDGRTDLSQQESGKTYVYETTWVFSGANAAQL